jgi:hypothetical protein
LIFNYKSSISPVSNKHYSAKKTERLVHLKRFSAAFQLITSQIALKYSALRFWYWRLLIVSIKVSSLNTQNRPELAHHWILVRICLDLHAARLNVLYQPRPSTSLHTRKRCVELLLERVQAAVALINGLAESACWGLTAALVGGRQVLPEERVVEVAAAVEVDHGLQGDLCGNVLLLLCFGDLLAEVVE